MIVPALSSRHCERSDAIQGGARTLWIATSPAAPRNDGIGNLRGFVASCESKFFARRHEGTKGTSQPVLAFPIKALGSADWFYPKPFPKGEGLPESLRLDGGVQ